MREYARQRGLRRVMIPVPLLTPRLSSLWLGLVTPLFARVGRKLVDSVRHPTVVRDDSARRLFPIRPVGVRAAIARALQNEDSGFAQTRWSDALSAAANAPRQWGGTRLGNRLVDARSTHVAASPAKVFAALEHIGGEEGWYYANWLWTLRGWLDCSSAESECVVVAVIRSGYKWATRWIVGASNSSSRASGCGWLPR